MPVPTFLDRNQQPVERASHLYQEINEALEAYLRLTCFADPRRLQRPISGLIRDLAEFYSQEFD